MEYKLREMTIDDIDAVIKGETEIFGDSLGFDMLYQEITLNPYAHYIVLDIDGSVEGYVGFWIEGEHSELINFYVSKKYQNQGFGSMMLDFIISVCESVKCKNLSLEVRVSNEKAIHLYKSFGFVESHIRKEYYSNHEDAIVMILEV